jgi:hypothetical protein
MLTVFRHDTYSVRDIDNQTYEERVAFHTEVGEAKNYQEAWNIICREDLRAISCLYVAYKNDQNNNPFPRFAWPTGVNYVYYNSRNLAPVVPPSEYNQNSVLELIRVLNLPFRIEGTEELDG